MDTRTLSYGLKPFTCFPILLTNRKKRPKGFSILVLDWMDFLRGIFLRHWRKTWKIWESFIFNEFFRFCFLLFEVNLEFIWFSLLVLVSMHLLCEIFLRNVKKNLTFFRIFQKVPKFLNSVGTKKFWVSQWI